MARRVIYDDCEYTLDMCSSFILSNREEEIRSMVLPYIYVRWVITYTCDCGSMGELADDLRLIKLVSCC